MSTMSEKIELLGKGLYTDIPDVLTLSAIPTASELDYVSSEDFDSVMLDKILPQAVDENINFRNLLFIDYMWICRALRIMNYGPYHTTNMLLCVNGDCGILRGEYQVDLQQVECKPIPEDMKSPIVKISKDEFIEFDEDIFVRIPTVQNILDSKKDTLFDAGDNKRNSSLAQLCYLITQIGPTNVTPVEAKQCIMHRMSAADYKILIDVAYKLTDYGLRGGGRCTCPKCHGEASFIAPTEDLFFRPTVGDLRRWKRDRDQRKDEDSSRDTETTV